MMAITEADRYAMHTDLIQNIGEKAANTLMEHLPPSGWANVATMKDFKPIEEKIQSLEKTMNTGFANIDRRLTAMSNGMWAAGAIIATALIAIFIKL